MAELDFMKPSLTEELNTDYKFSHGMMSIMCGGKWVM